MDSSRQRSDRAARRSILERLLDKRPSAKLDLDFVAEKTPGFSGADLENIVELASDAAIEASLEQGKEVPIEQAHLTRALGEARPTTSEWLTTARNYARYANQGGLYDDVLSFLDKHAKA